MNNCARKHVFGVFDTVQHKPGSTVTEDGYRVEISDLRSRSIYYICSEKKKGVNHLHIRLCKMQVFSWHG